jgi:enoyl-[acyl-carrier-protein] reductase (NADH)
MPGALAGKVAVVTGATRGVGKGVALGLGEAGATVYVTGRTVQAKTARLTGTIGETAEEVSRLGGHGIAVRCDHANDADVEALFQRVKDEQGRLDILVNLDADRFGESPQFTGRAVAALASDPNVLEKTGQSLEACDLAEEYGFTDTDGTLPPRSVRLAGRR